LITGGSTSGVECCFCGIGVNDGEARTLTLALSAAGRAGDNRAPRQQLWCHAGCVAERLAPGVVFDVDVFDD
jgi:hypothetical protein